MTLRKLCKPDFLDLTITLSDKHQITMIATGDPLQDLTLKASHQSVNLSYGCKVILEVAVLLHSESFKLTISQFVSGSLLRTPS